MPSLTHPAQISTKLSPPVLRPDLVPRPWLGARLDRCATHHLTLVSAPAGSGKTTLLGQWAQASQRPVAWVSLDRGDDDPVRFWSYVATALGALEPRIGEHLLPMLHSAQPETGGPLIAMLINFVAQIHRPFVLILDDYHCITSEGIHASLATLLDYMPPAMHLVISSRHDPPLPLARWRAQGRLAELRAADLRLAPGEAATLLRDTMGADLSDEEVDSLYSWTEGWAAGLQLAGLTIEQQRAHRSGFSTPELRQDGRHLADYIAAEVLEQQPQALRSFLLRTAILDTLNAPLCDAVTGQAHSRELLEELYRRNLFVSALDRRGRYRYHHLLAEFLRARAQQELAAELPTLHARAADWYAQQGLLDEAIGHALSAEQVGEAVQLIRQVARQRLMQGEALTVLAWLRALPEEALLGEPLFCLLFAWAAVNSGQIQAAIPYLEHLEATIPEDGEDALLLGEIATVRARAATLQGDAGGHAWYAQRALALLPREETLARSDALLDLAFAHNDNGDPHRAEAAFQECIEASRAAGNLRTAMLAIYYLGELRLARGRAYEAARLYQQGLAWCQEAAPPSFPACWPHTGLGALLYEWNDLAEAEEHLRSAIALAEQCGEPKPMMYGRIALARLLQALGQPEDALAALERADEIARQTGIAQIAAMVNLARIQLWLAQGQRERAGAWLRQHGLSLAHDTLSPDEVTMLAWFHLTPPGEGRAALRVAAERILAQIGARCRAAEEPHVGWQQARDRILLAVAYSALEQNETALAHMRQAVAIAEPMGLLRLFADGPGPAVGALVRQLAAEQDASNHVRRLAALVGAEQPAAGSHDPLVEALRPREIEVLQQVARGRSDQEIADALILGVSTVKWHLRNIYGKLGVHRRTQAVAKARALDLLPPE